MILSSSSEDPGANFLELELYLIQLKEDFFPILVPNL
jgi:hypothetical protein